MDQPGIHISLAEPANHSLEPEHLNKKSSINALVDIEPQDCASSSTPSRNPLPLRYAQQVVKLLCKFAKFTGPGAIISVAYIDRDNCQSDLTAGALFEYKLLCAVVFSNLVAVFLQAVATKLGCVTGMDLAQMNRTHLYPWVIIALWILAEGAIICTDIRQVIGTAIALNLLNSKIAMIARCVISVSDTLFILLFYNPDGFVRRLWFFEMFISVFVFANFIMFCIKLSLITAPAGEVFKGLLPSKTIFTGQALFQSCVILGGNLVPHTIWLGSGLVQAPVRKFDHKNKKYEETRISSSRFPIKLYRPTLPAIKSCMTYTIAKLCIALFVIANFVNSAILIIAGASLSPDNGNADLPGMYQLFVDTIGAAAGTLFAVGLLFSRVSAGIVVTMAGQLVCEGTINWRVPPFWRRLLTTCFAIVPAVVIAAAKGQKRLGEALVVCSFVLSVKLMFVTATLVWYTGCERYMRVGVGDRDGVVGVVEVRGEEIGGRENTVSFANGWAVMGIGWLLWFLLARMNVAILMFFGVRDLRG